MQKFFKNSDSKCYCSDIFEWGPMERNFDHNIKLSGFQKNVIKLKGPSWKTLRTLTNFEEFDAIYVDGWHGANGVIEDAILCWKLLKVGGIIYFDDYLWGPQFKPQRRPREAIDMFHFIFSPFLEEINGTGKKAFKKIISNNEEIFHLIKHYE